MTKHGLPMAWMEDHADYMSDDCIAWPFTKTAEGYGRIWAYGRMYPAHRLMCELVHGKPDNSQMHAAHSCGNGHLGCINPKHLRWATKLENEADKRLHGRIATGERNGAAKISDAAVAVIREIAPYATQAMLCRHYGLSAAHVSRIVNGTRRG